MYGTYLKIMSRLFILTKGKRDGFFGFITAENYKLLTLRKIHGQLCQQVSGQANQTVDGNDFGFGSFTLLDEKPDQITYGLTGHFWHPTMGVIPLKDADAFCQFDDVTTAKLLLRFTVMTDTEGSRLHTEIFIHCPTAKVKRLSCYWMVIRPASGWIRRRTLRTVQRQLAR
ncbi:hypothetical protein [Kosakonia radicincitans]|uniref:hypothetical protein n=1 Tax=Kosakonia radicincitans TaxID=283686 RepID=UPI000B07E1CC|nr:hypothetical protein [Kosakonia radicincitans]